MSKSFLAIEQIKMKKEKRGEKVNKKDKEKEKEKNLLFY